MAAKIGQELASLHVFCGIEVCMEDKMFNCGVESMTLL
jgi:hypothetical protein